MADEIDAANKIVEDELSRALDKIRQNNKTKNEKGAKYCVECGDNMPEVRQMLGFKLCVPCAEEEERRKSLFAD